MFQDKKLRHYIYILIIGILTFLFIFLLVKLFPFYKALISFFWHLFTPFLVACLIAYLLYPIIQTLHEHNIHKGLSILLIYILFFGGTAYLIYRVYPAMIHQLRDFNEHLPQFIRMYEELIYALYDSTSFLPEAVHDQFDQLINRIESSLEKTLGKLLAGFTKIFDLILFLTIIPVLVFYFLKDYEKIKMFFSQFIPKRYRRRAGLLLHAVDESFGNYIRGQLIVSSFVSLTTLIIFHLLKVKYPLLLAIIMGFTNIIPYFGPIIGAVPAVAIALTESVNLVIFVLIAILGIQLIESNLLSPYIVGKSVNIHPIAIIFALLLGGQVSGVLGMILAVPLLTILKVIATHIIVLRHEY
ncbi:MAG TPA: AI-2E family transporter [Virgibacillus sp.]|nr:AI-2E family transporter [Virgibacillus sp.]